MLDPFAGFRGEVSAAGLAGPEGGQWQRSHVEEASFDEAYGVTL